MRTLLAIERSDVCLMMIDATEVANIFKEYLTTTHKCFDSVVFAVPSGRDGNYEKFVKVF